MTVRCGTRKALAMLLPAGVLGISTALAAFALGQTEPSRPDGNGSQQASSVAERLREIRAGVSEINVPEQNTSDLNGALLAEWLNFGGGVGWRNGGWGNGGWHNWGNGGWHNAGWGNGGWHNWGNGGWHNWHNFWHNW